jgi:hypothetical protein
LYLTILRYPTPHYVPHTPHHPGPRVGAGVVRVFREDQEAAERTYQPAAAVSGIRRARHLYVPHYCEHGGREQQLVSGEESVGEGKKRRECRGGERERVRGDRRRGWIRREGKGR